jgi:hypothetical protein
MPITILTRPVRRFLSERLERLREALENLGRRLRESVAQLLGTHIGETVRQAVENALQVQPLRRYDPEPFYRHGGRERHFEDDDFEEDRFWGREPSVWEPPEPETPIENEKPSRWKAVLDAALHGLFCFVRPRCERPSLLKLVGIGAAIGLATLLGVPVIGGAVLALAAMLLLKKLAGTDRPANATTF